MRVYGIENLRIVDVSVFFVIFSVYIMVFIVMVGRRFGEMILEEVG